MCWFVSTESALGTSPANVCTDVGVFDNMELLLLSLNEDSGFVSIMLHFFAFVVLIPAIEHLYYEGQIFKIIYIRLIFLRAMKFGWRYFPDDTSSWARRSFTLRDSKSIIFSSKETEIKNKHILFVIIEEKKLFTSKCSH